MSINLKTLGSTIKKYRAAKNYSTQELASRLGVSVGFINHLENGKNDAFKLELFISLIKELDIPLSEIVSDKTTTFDDLNINSVSEKLEISLTHDGVSNFNVFKSELEEIITCYIKAVSEYNYNATVIESISKHVIDEINYIKDFKSII